MRPLLAIALSITSTACQHVAPPEPTAAAPILDNTFRNCVDRETKAAFDRAIAKNGDLAIYGYHTDIENDVITTCNPRLTIERLQDSVYSTNPIYSYVNAAVEARYQTITKEKIEGTLAEEHKQAELDAPILKVEKEEENAAGTGYYQCLDRHAKILAISSSEPAEVIVQASFPSCSTERQAVFDTYQRHKNHFEAETMDIVEAKFKQSLLLDVIKARAQRLAPSESSPVKRDTPI
jgi:hypothetical protein